MSNELNQLKQILKVINQINDSCDLIPHIESAIQGLDKRLADIEKSIDEINEKLTN
jgi:hypothetical protein